MRFADVCFSRRLWRFPGYLSRTLSSRRPSATRICIDIGSRFIKLLESERRGASVWVDKRWCLETPEGAIANHTVIDVVAVAGAIRQALDSAQVTTRRAVTCIPGPSAMIKRFRLPLKDAERLDALVRTEIDNLSSCGPDSLCVDHRVGEVHLEEALEVLIAAARRETVQSYVATLEHAGLQVEVVDVDHLALENMFSACHGIEASRTVALVHVGSRFCTVSIQSHGSWRFSGNVAVGTDSGAEVGAIVTEVNRALQFYWPESAGDRIDEIVLSGGGAAVPTIAAELAARIGCPVRNANPFGRFKFGSARELEQVQTASSFAVAAGLAMRSVEEP